MHLNKEDITLLDSSINALRNINQNIILYSASKLVDLSHKWESWQTAIAIAEILGKGSEKMRTNLIRNDKQYFSIWQDIPKVKLAIAYNTYFPTDWIEDQDWSQDKEKESFAFCNSNLNSG